MASFTLSLIFIERKLNGLSDSILFIPDPSSVMAAQFGFELQYDN